MYEGSQPSPPDNIFEQSTPDAASGETPEGSTPAPTQSVRKGEIIADTIKCNDGRMKLEIVAQEMKGSGTGKHVEYKVVG